MVKQFMLLQQSPWFFRQSVQPMFLLFEHLCSCYDILRITSKLGHIYVMGNLVLVGQFGIMHICGPLALIKTLLLVIIIKIARCWFMYTL
jgi:hypothetical protein